MYVAENKPTAYFDVDDTLIEWKSPSMYDIEESKNEFNTLKKEIVIVDFEDRKIPLFIRSSMIEELKMQATRGTLVVVWSRSGVAWAAAVVKALELEEYINVVLAKPDRYYDDKDASEWMPNRRYF